MNYWLMKSEPDVFGIDHLKEVTSEPWDGVRNYQARNFMRAMRRGDPVLFYHSNCKPPGIAGIMQVVGEARVDPTQFDHHDHHYDPKSHPDNPRWDLVDVAFKRKFKHYIALDELRANADQLGDLALLRRGNRLSIMPVSKPQWQYILALAKAG